MGEYGVPIVITIVQSAGALTAGGAGVSYVIEMMHNEDGNIQDDKGENSGE